MSSKQVLLIVALALIDTNAAARPPSSRPAPAVAPVVGDEPGALPAPAPAAASRPARAFRFDALRIDGQLRGPAVLEVKAPGRAARGRLLVLRRSRSFVDRIFGTIEAPPLYGR